MRNILYENIRGLVAKSSQLELKSEVVENASIDNDRYLLVTATISIDPKLDLSISNKSDTLKLVIKHNNEEVLLNKSIEILLDSTHMFSYSVKVPLYNTQTEMHLLEAILTSDNNFVEDTIISDSIAIESSSKSKASIFLNYYNRGKVHHFSYYTSEPTDEVYVKINNNNWRKIYEGFSINDDDLEGAVNYVQLYMKDSERQKVYSNVIRVVKIGFSE